MSTMVLVTPVSHNRKTGPMMVTLVEPSTCPPACGIAKDCYAQFFKTWHNWQRVRTYGVSWELFCGHVRELRKGTLWRYGEAGDLPGKGDHVSSRQLRRLIEANRGKRGFGYTHKPVLGDGEQARRNRTLIAEANANGFTLNLSADSMLLADALAALNIGPVAVVLPRDVKRPVRTAKGRHVAICPHALNPAIQCVACGLCAKADRSSIIGFPAHGPAAKRLTMRLQSA